MNPNINWSIPLTFKLFFGELLKLERLAAVLWSTMTSGVSVIKLLQRNLIKLAPADTVLRVSDDGSVGLFFTGKAVILHEMSSDVLKLKDQVIERISGEDVDTWPEFVQRMLGSVSVNSGQPLQLSEDGLYYTPVGQWRIMKREGQYMLVHPKNDQKGRVAVITVMANNVSSVEEDMLTQPFIVAQS